MLAAMQIRKFWVSVCCKSQRLKYKKNIILPRLRVFGNRMLKILFTHKRDEMNREKCTKRS
jgi:hypothetical protein